MNLSIIIPILNEEMSLPALIAKLGVICIPYAPFEIICVDDGSTDKSLQILKDIQKNISYLKIVQHEKNYGKTSAIFSALELAKGSIIITIDADLQNPPEEIPKLLKNIKNYDGVFGVRIHRKDSLIKIITSKISNFIRRKLLSDHSQDSGCGLKAFKSHVFKQFPQIEGLHRFFPSLFTIYGFSFIEIEIVDLPRKMGRSKYNTFWKRRSSLFDFLAVYWLKRRYVKIVKKNF